MRTEQVNKCEVIAYKVLANISESTVFMINTVDSEMFARTLFSLIHNVFANSVPREFKVLANIENTCFI